MPAGTRPSLRPLRGGAERSEQSSGVWCRENANSCSLLKMKWCCQTGLNCRPLHYQWSALPLSYGSMCPDKNRPEGPTRRADPCHKAPRCASCRAVPNRAKSGRYRGRNGRLRPERPTFADFGSDVPANWPVGQLGEFDNFEFRTIGQRRPLELPQSLGMLATTRCMEPGWLTRTTRHADRPGSPGRRLKSALRENLKRRKMQARERDDKRRPLA